MAGASIPDTLVPVHTLVLWLHLIQAHPAAAGRRADWWRNTTAVVWQLILHTGPDMVTSPRKGATWALLAAKAGVSRRTLADRLRWLREIGALFTLVSGSTPLPPRLPGRPRRRRARQPRRPVRPHRAPGRPGRHGPRGAGAADRHAPPRPRALTEELWQDVPWPVEVLPVEVTRTPSVSMVALSDNTSPVYAREESGQNGTSPATPERTWPSTVTPETKPQMLEACRRLREDVHVLRRISRST
nr:hypothetical protein GCM10020093_117490 [Planobispora longispora]